MYHLYVHPFSLPHSIPWPPLWYPDTASSYEALSITLARRPFAKARRLAHRWRGSLVEAPSNRDPNGYKSCLVHGNSNGLWWHPCKVQGSVIRYKCPQCPQKQALSHCSSSNVQHLLKVLESKGVQTDKLCKSVRLRCWSGHFDFLQ